MSSSNCFFLTCIQISQEADQVVYSHLLKNFPQLIVIHTVKGFGIVNKAEIDVFLELSCFFDDPADVGNLISGSSAFSQTSLNIWKFTVNVLLKPGSVISTSLWPHQLQYARLPCPLPSPGVCSNSCWLSQWYYATISSCVIPFLPCLQSFPASGSFPVNRLFTSSGQSIGASVSASVLPMNIQGWFPLRLTGSISLQSKRFSRVFSSTTIQKHNFFGTQPSLLSNFHIHIWLLVKIALTIWTFISKVMSLFFNILSRFVIAFLPRSKFLLFHGYSHHPPWFWSPRK